MLQRVCVPLQHHMHWWSITANALVQEKFLSLRHRLCGVPSTGFDAPDELALLLKELFAQVEVAFYYLGRERGWYKRSYRQYNFTFRRFFDLIHAPELSRDFPPLKTEKKRREVAEVWLACCIFLKWPYINSDADQFGERYGVSYSELRRPQSPARQPHTENRDRGLGPCASGASEPSEPISLQSLMPWLFDPCTGAVRDDAL